MPPATRRGGRGGRGRSHGSGQGTGEDAAGGAPVNVDMAAMLAEMQAMRAELKALH